MPIATAIRGYRNANPANLRRTKEKWVGLRSEQTDKAFFQFTSMVYGIRALAKTLITYRDKYQLHTVRGLINRFAPPCENPTEAYVNNVAKRMQVAPDMAIDTRMPEVMFAMVRGIIAQECGMAALLISDDTVRSGIALAPDPMNLSAPPRTTT
jgi:hypothetical protein